MLYSGKMPCYKKTNESANPVLLKYGSNKNEPKRAKMTQNDPELARATYSHPKWAKITQEWAI